MRSKSRTSPFFSVVIPTKNRSELIGFAVQSVLNQTFEDYELILVDNDDTDETRRVLDQFEDHRIRYFRTGDLPMHENWDYGIKQARGEYVTMIEDKEALRPKALARIFRALEKNSVNIVTWLVDYYNDRGEVTFFHRQHKDATHQERIVTSEEILNIFLTSDRGMFRTFLPRGTNSCCRRSLIDKIVSGPAESICPPVSPDYTMAYLQLAYTNETLHIDEALVVAGMRLSNGRAFQLKEAARSTFVRQAGGEGKLYNLAPIKTPLVNNTIYNDYMNIRELVGLNLKSHPLDLENYFVQCYRDIADGISGYKTDMSREMAAWKAALQNQEPRIQSAVQKSVALIEKEMQKAIRRSELLKLRTQAITFGKWLRLNKLRKIIAPKYEDQEKTGFPNILAAIEWDEMQKGS